MKNYIKELLYTHNSVIIPAFGGFTATYKPASIDHVQGVIFPPSKDLKFNRYLTVNDGLLVQYICEQKGWTREEAEQAIKNWVANMKTSLERREMLEIPQVGRLYLDFEGNYRFLQDNTNYNRQSFGLPNVEFFPVTRTRNTATPQEAQAKSTATPILTLGNEQSKSKIISLWFQRNIPYIVAASFLVLAGTFFLISSQNDDQADTAFIKPVSEERINIKPSYQPGESTTIEETYIAETPSEESEAVVTNDDYLDTPPDEDIDTEGETVVPSQQEAIVVIGSFGNKKNIERLIKKIYAHGYEPFLKKEGSLTKVGVQFAYNTNADIEAKRKDVAKDFRVAAWVLSSKK